MMQPRTAMAPAGVSMETALSDFEILPPTKRITPLEKDAAIWPVPELGS
jgi:hypothetical protein